MALVQTPGGISREDILQVLARVSGEEFSMIIIEGDQAIAYGFINDDVYDELFQFETENIAEFVRPILDDMELETDDGIYEHGEFRFMLLYSSGNE